MRKLLFLFLMPLALGTGLAYYARESTTGTVAAIFGKAPSGPVFFHDNITRLVFNDANQDPCGIHQGQTTWPHCPTTPPTSQFLKNLVIDSTAYPDLYKFAASVNVTGADFLTNLPVTLGRNYAGASEEAHQSSNGKFYWNGNKEDWESDLKIVDYTSPVYTRGSDFTQAYKDIGLIAHLEQDSTVPAHADTVFHGLGNAWGPGPYVGLSPAPFDWGRPDSFEMLATQLTWADAAPVVETDYWAAVNNATVPHPTSVCALLGDTTKYWLTNGEVAPGSTKGWGAYGSASSLSLSPCAKPSSPGDVDFYPDDTVYALLKAGALEPAPTLTSAIQIAKTGIYLAAKKTSDELKRISQELPPLISTDVSSLTADLSQGAVSFGMSVQDNRSSSVSLIIEETTTGRSLRGSVKEDSQRVLATQQNLDGSTSIALPKSSDSDLTKLPYFDHLTISWDGTMADGGSLPAGTYTLKVNARDGDGNYNTDIAFPTYISLSVIAGGKLPAATVTDLGTFGGQNSRAIGINATGQVAGSATTSTGNWHPFLYTNGVMKDLGTPPGYTQCFAAGLSPAGWVAGSCSQGGIGDAFVYKNGAMTDLGFLGGATAVNTSGEIGGSKYGTSGSISPGFLYANGAYTYFNNFNSVLSINILGDFIGGSATTSGNFLYLNSGRSIIDLGGFQPNQINDSGQIAGVYLGHASFYSYNGVPIDLGTLGTTKGDRFYSTALGINGTGQIVGWSDTNQYNVNHAFLYTGGAARGSCTMIDLNSLLPANSGWQLQLANGINDAGQIVGSGTNAAGQSHAFLLTLPGYNFFALRICPVALEAAVSGQSYTTTFAAAGGTAQPNWTLSPGSTAPPSGFVLSPSGVLSTTGTPPASAGTYSFSVRVTDNASGGYADQSVVLVVEPPVAIQTSSLPAVAVGQSYGEAHLNATGGSGTYSWSVSAGVLPAGVWLSGSGELSSINTYVMYASRGLVVAPPGSYPLTFRATDSSGVFAEKQLTLQVLPNIQIVNVSLPYAVAGQPYSSGQLATSGTTAAPGWTVSAGALPPGFALSSAGVLSSSGTPVAAPNSYSFSLRATDGASGAYAEQVFTLLVTPAIQITSATLPNAIIGQTYSIAQLTATGASGSFTWTITSGTLPAGFVLQTTGVLAASSGVQTTAGPYAFRVRATDTNSPAFAETNLTLTVAAPSLSSQTIAFGAPGNVALGTVPFGLAAAASSGLPVTFVSNATAVCTVSGGNVTLLTAGTCSITASQSGNASYAAATPVTRTFTVAPGSQTISFGSLSNLVVNSGSVALSATASSGLPVSFASTTAGVCTVSGNTVTLLAVGPCSITATQAGNANYLAATAVSQSFTVAPFNGVTLTAGNGSGTAGQTVEIPIQLASSGTATPAGFQLDLSFDVTKLTFVSARTGASSAAAGKTLSTSAPTGGNKRLLVSGANQNAIANGIVAYASFTLGATFTSGSTSVSALNCTSTDASGNSLPTPCVAGTIRSAGCDVNSDGTVSVADVQLVINEALGVTPAVHDLNHDSLVNVADVQIVINAALGLGCSAT